MFSNFSEKFEAFKEQTLKVILWYLLLIFGVILLGIYLGDALFGNRSVEVLFDLQDQKKQLITDIKDLKEQNAMLQKQYLERLALEPEAQK